MKINTKNKKPLILITSSIASLALVSLPLATAISCGSTQTNSESVDNNNNNNGNNNNNNGSGGNGNTDNNKPNKPVVPPTEVKPEKPDPSSPIVNNEVIANDPFYEKYGTRLFDLSKFKGKTLDEINIDLIKSAMIPQDSSKVSYFYLQERNGSFIKNKDLNCFNIEFSLYLTGDEVNLGGSSYLTVFLPLSATSKETLSADQLKNLVSKATNDQYLNSFKDILNNKSSNFQSLLCVDGAGSYLRSLIGYQKNTYPYVLDTTKFSYDLNNNDEILKGSFRVGFSRNSEINKVYNFTLKNAAGNIYEKVTINGKTFLRFTMAKDSIEVSDVSKAVYKNQKEAVFYIDITT